jgi:hypothetical protein
LGSHPEQKEEKKKTKKKTKTNKNLFLLDFSCGRKKKRLRGFSSQSILSAREVGLTRQK